MKWSYLAGELASRTDRKVRDSVHEDPLSAGLSWKVHDRVWLEVAATVRRAMRPMLFAQFMEDTQCHSYL